MELHFKNLHYINAQSKLPAFEREFIRQFIGYTVNILKEMEEEVRSNSEGSENSAQQDNDNGEQSDYG